MSVRRSLLVLTVLTLLLPTIAFGIVLRQERRSAQGAALQNLQLYRVERGDVQVVVTAIGSVEADNAVQLSFVTAGRVKDVLASPGDYVLAGDALVELENGAQSVAYQQALLRLEKAQLDLQDLEEPSDDSAVRIAQANLDSARSSYLALQNAVTPQDIQAAELAYQEAQTLYENLKSRRDQAIGGYNSPAYITLDAQTGAASFNAEIARLRLESLRNGTAPQLYAASLRVQQAQRELDRAQAGPTHAQLDASTIAVQQAQSQLDQADTAYHRAELDAPFDGVVTAVNVEQGSLVGPGVTVVELTDVSPLRLTVQVDEIDIGQIHEGMPASVELDALPGVYFPATLEHIALVGTNDGGIVSYDVDMALYEPDPRIRVGMTAEASITVDQRTNVLYVPNLYIRLDRVLNKAYVNVLHEDGTLEEVEVQLGLVGQDSSEVVSGLHEGDLVAIDLSGDRFSFFGG